MALSSASRVLAQVFTRKHPSIVQCSDSPPPARWVNTRGTHLPLEPTEAHHDRTQASANECPSATELDNFKWGARLNGPETLISTALPSLSTPKSNTWRAAAAILAFFIQGMNDSAPGALIPYMETHYRIGYAIVSLIFVANAVGFIAAAPLCHVLTNRFGRSKVLAACTLINAAAYVAIACQPPFAVVVIAFAFLGKSGQMLPNTAEPEYRVRIRDYSFSRQCLHYQSQKRDRHTGSDAWLLWYRWDGRALCRYCHGIKWCPVVVVLLYQSGLVHGQQRHVLLELPKLRA